MKVYDCTGSYLTDDACRECFKCEMEWQELTPEQRQAYRDREEKRFRKTQGDPNNGKEGM